MIHGNGALRPEKTVKSSVAVIPSKVNGAVGFRYNGKLCARCKGNARPFGEFAAPGAVSSDEFQHMTLVPVDRQHLSAR